VTTAVRERHRCTATATVGERHPAIGERHHWHWRTPPLLWENTTAAMGEHHRCRGRTPLLLWENTIVATGEHHYCQGRTSLLPRENTVVAMGELIKDFSQFWGF
ncbi:hypothetical protein V8G54_031620, partial [Vigna mungo]